MSDRVGAIKKCNLLDGRFEELIRDIDKLDYETIKKEIENLKKLKDSIQDEFPDILGVPFKAWYHSFHEMDQSVHYADTLPHKASMVEALEKAKTMNQAIESKLKNGPRG